MTFSVSSNVHVRCEQCCLCVGYQQNASIAFAKHHVDLAFQSGMHAFCMGVGNRFCSFKNWHD